MHLCAACRKLLPPTSSCPDCRAALRPRASDVLVGETIAEHRVEGVLGTGAVGVVYLASDGAGRQRALKLMLPDPSDETAERRFLREAQVIQGLHHPHIVEVYGVGDSGWGTPYFTMECLKGRTLRRRLQDAPPGGLPRDEALGILRQIADALAYAHARGIVHRDVKPSNVLVRPDGTSKLLDFGLAGFWNSDLTVTGRLFGSPSYMSPERVRGDRGGTSSDQFSLGVVLHEMLTGTNPFAGDSLEAWIRRVLDVHPPPLQRDGRPIPEPLNRIVLRAIAKQEDARFPTMEVVVRELAAAGAALGLPLERYEPRAS